MSPRLRRILFGTRPPDVNGRGAGPPNGLLGCSMLILCFAVVFWTAIGGRLVGDAMGGYASVWGTILALGGFAAGLVAAVALFRRLEALRSAAAVPQEPEDGISSRSQAASGAGTGRRARMSLRTFMANAILGRHPTSNPKQLQPWELGVLGWINLGAAVVAGAVMTYLVSVPLYALFPRGPWVNSNVFVGMFAMVLFAASGLGTGAMVHRVLERARGRAVERAETALRRASEEQQALDERAGLLSAASAPQDEDVSTLLRPQRGEEQAPETLLRRTEPPQ